MAPTISALNITPTVENYRSKFANKPPTKEAINTRSVTIKQLLDASRSPKTKGRFILNNSLIYTVTICGKVVSIDQEEGYTDFIIYDGTGNLDARIWCRGFSQLTDLSGGCKDSYYMVIGTVVPYEDKLLLQTIKATMVTDHNTITMHMLEAIHQHSSLESMDAHDSDQWETARKDAEEQIRGPLRFQFDKEAIIELLSETEIRQSEWGASTTYIQHALHMDDATSRVALDALLNEGSIYNTKDYDHYMIADGN